VSWPDVGVTLAASFGAAVFGFFAWFGRRLTEWYFPKGHHSRRVHRYGVRDDLADAGDTTDDGDTQDDGR